jgi:hypothetical protein
MNPKQLANVLVKILGLSLCAHSITSVIVAILGGLQIGVVGFQNWPRQFFPYLISLIVSLLPFAIGIFLILRSRWITEFLFKNEAE